MTLHSTSLMSTNASNNVAHISYIISFFVVQPSGVTFLSSCKMPPSSFCYCADCFSVLNVLVASV